MEPPRDHSDMINGWKSWSERLNTDANEAEKEINDEKADFNAQLASIPGLQQSGVNAIIHFESALKTTSDPEQLDSTTGIYSELTAVAKQAESISEKLPQFPLHFEQFHVQFSGIGRDMYQLLNEITNVLPLVTRRQMQLLQTQQELYIRNWTDFFASTAEPLAKNSPQIVGQWPSRCQSVWGHFGALGELLRVGPRKKETMVEMVLPCLDAILWDNAVNGKVSVVLNSFVEDYGGDGMPASLKAKVDDMLKKLPSLPNPTTTTAPTAPTAS